jgi:oligopeptide transport system substrate-binding protein
LAISLGGLACDGASGGGAASSNNPNAEAEFVYANRAEVTMLDPNQMSWMQDIRVGQAIFEGAYMLQAETLEPKLGAAESVEHSEDYKTWTIKVRPEAKWSNGDPVTADDFIFAWRRQMREEGPYSYLVNEYVEGAGEYSQSYKRAPAEADFSKVGIRRLDDKTVEVKLAYPTPFFPDLLAFVSYWPLNERSMKKFEQTDPATGRIIYDRAFMQPGNLVSNGPYVLTQWQPKTGLTLSMNEHYWDAASIKSRTVRALSISDPNVALQRYEQGLIDWVPDLPGQLAYDLKQAGREDLYVHPAYGTYFWTFNTYPTLPEGTKNPLNDIRVRQALAAAVDKEQIVNTITKLGEMPTTSFVPQNAEYFKGYKHPQGVAFDVEKAKALLAEAGYGNGQGFPRLKLLYDTDNTDHAQIAQNLARQWQQKLGIQFDLEGIENAQFKQRYKPDQKVDSDGRIYFVPGEFHICRGSWYGDYMDVTTFTDKYLANSQNNEPVWQNARYNELCRLAQGETDPQKRLDLLAEAESILVNEVPILPLYHYVNNEVHRPDITGLAKNPRKMINMKNVATPRSTGPGVGPDDGKAPGVAPTAAAE